MDRIDQAIETLKGIGVWFLDADKWEYDQALSGIRTQFGRTPEGVQLMCEAFEVVFQGELPPDTVYKLVRYDFNRSVRSSDDAVKFLTFVWNGLFENDMGDGGQEAPT